MVIKAIESQFMDALIDQTNETIHFNNVLKRNIGGTNLNEIKSDLAKLIETLENFEISAN